MPCHLMLPRLNEVVFAGGGPDRYLTKIYSDEVFCHESR